MWASFIRLKIEQTEVPKEVLPLIWNSFHCYGGEIKVLCSDLWKLHAISECSMLPCCILGQKWVNSERIFVILWMLTTYVKCSLYVLWNTNKIVKIWNIFSIPARPLGDVHQFNKIISKSYNGHLLYTGMCYGGRVSLYNCLISHLQDHLT